METGITFGVEFAGLVAPYEERAAMRDAHYNAHEWAEITPGERAEAVAFYRISRYVSLHEQDAVSEAMRRKQNA